MFSSEEGGTFTMRAFAGEVALHMSRFMHGDRSSIPSIYNMVEETAELLGLHLESIEVYSKGSALRSNLHFSGKGGESVLQGYRASDAIAMALLYDAKIMLERSLVQYPDSIIEP
ncbi:MAG: bifunctional nuclease family protein [Nitrososphaerota archaeon]|nr:bifunctional nuclease family protein [Nitrososphaerota archaeon]